MATFDENNPLKKASDKIEGLRSFLQKPENTPRGLVNRANEYRKQIDRPAGNPIQRPTYIQLQEPQTGGPATTPEGTKTQLGQGGEGSVAANANPSGYEKFNANDDGPDNFLNPHKPGNFFGDTSRDVTSFDRVAAGRPASPGQQGLRLGSSVGRVPEDAYNVIGKQDDSNNIVTQRYAAALADLRARSNTQGSQETTGIPEREGIDPYEAEVRANQRDFSMKQELKAIDEARRFGKISARNAFAAANAVRSRYSEEDLATAKLGEEAYKTDVGAYSDEATRKANTSIARDKLAYDQQSDLLDRLATQQKADYTQAKDERDYALSLGKFNLDRDEFAGLQDYRRSQVKEAETRLGTQAGQLQVSAENALTGASQEIRNLWKSVSEGVVPKAAAVKQTIAKYGVHRAIDFDPDALAIKQAYLENPTPENMAKGDELLRKLGYFEEQ